jgi:serine phosphatase RsbU (regulator of sigma subunit)
MEDELRAARELPPSKIIERLHNAVVRFSNGTEQQDDLTAVLIKCGTSGKSGIPQEN